MHSKKRMAGFLLYGCILIALLLGGIFTGSKGKHESIKEVMRDAVLHDTNKISFFGIKDVNPAFISAVTVTVVLLLIALCIRIFVIPKFRYVPGKFQLLLEQWVGFFDRLAKSNSPHRNGFLGVYLFGAGSYIFVGTLFELLGLQGITTLGVSIALPAPLSDINAAIALGCLSYLIILSGGIAGNRLRGVGKTLKDFSLPISMSFRLFGALLSGLLVTELVYYFIQLSFVLPVLVGVMFTLLHALIQTYVLTMLTALFYGEVSEPSEKSKAELKKTEARKLKTLLDEEISMAEKEAAAVRAAAVKNAETETAKRLTAARTEAEKIVSDAKTQAQAEKEKILSGAQIEIAQLAAAAVQKAFSENLYLQFANAAKDGEAHG